MAMDQYLLIPFLGGWTSIYQLFWSILGFTRYQGFDPSPNDPKNAGLVDPGGFHTQDGAPDVRRWLGQGKQSTATGRRWFQAAFRDIGEMLIPPEISCDFLESYPLVN